VRNVTAVDTGLVEGVQVKLKLAVLGLVLAPSLLAFVPKGFGDEQPEYDWGVAYYMSYDNDLEMHGEPIIDRIARGVRGGNTVAAVQADFKDSGGMHRVLIRGSGVSRTRIASDDSADEDALAGFLDWFATSFRCRNYVVILLLG
jgi:hypothetical protein